MGQWLMHERQYFGLMVAAKCKIRPYEEKEQSEVEKSETERKEMTERVIEKGRERTEC